MDASLQIGTGHVMRCLTLAQSLKSRGADISFICRTAPGNLNERITRRGFRIIELNSPELGVCEGSLLHSNWLPVSQKQDADDCKPILKELDADWLVVDHYAIDYEWESELEPFSKNLMVIDDLADRDHVCDLLLDQTFGRTPEQYLNRIPERCTLLVGSEYCLLRPDFAEWRPHSLRRRAQASIENLLVAMGGVDAENYSEDVLNQLENCTYYKNINITLLVGGQYPHLRSLRRAAELSKHNVTIKVDVENMAEIMAASDIAIGAAGTTSWERCCLGLPTVLIVLADNQRFLAEKLCNASASVIAGKSKPLSEIIDDAESWMGLVSSASAKITDGSGASRVAAKIWQLS